MTTWWAWIAAAAVFGALEVLLPVFAFMGFAAGAAATGLLLLLGMSAGVGGTLLVFAVLSAVAFAGLRMVLGHDKGSERIVTKDINDN